MTTTSIPTAKPRSTWASTSTVYRAAAGSVRTAWRWRAGAVGAWLVGAVSGIAPVAFVGDPAPGLVAAAVLGAVGVALVSPLLIAPIVTTVVADDDQHQVAVHWHAAGVAPSRRILGRTLAAARTSLILLPTGALAAVVSVAGLTSTGHDPFAAGLRSAPSPAAIPVALTVLVCSWVMGALGATAFVSAARATLALVVSLVITGAVASLVYFAPSLRWPFWLTPWAALWPFDPNAFDAAQFARAIPLWVRGASGSAWLLVLLFAARRRLARDPYPVPGEQRRARRRCPRPPP